MEISVVQTLIYRLQTILLPLQILSMPLQIHMTRVQILLKCLQILFMVVQLAQNPVHSKIKPMPDSPIPPQTPWPGTLEDVVLVLNNIARWKILAMLCRTEWLPVHHLAGAAGVKPSAASKHMLVLLNTKVVERGFGRLYRIVPALRPAPGAEWLDLRFARMKLPWPAWS